MSFLQSFWEEKFSSWQIYEWEIIVDNWVFLAAMVLFAFEIVRLLFKKEMTWKTAGDSISNFITLGAHLVVIFFLAASYLVLFGFVYENYSFVQLPNNMWTVALCILLADFAYYWEHRVAHRIGIGWATHTVHHRSPYFNISVAYRHGPMDAIFGLPFHLPLAFLGFDPFLIFFSEMVVQLFQTMLHTEVVKKFPRFIEAIFNTPSHHRVHHGSNPQYIDKNYAGILIIWDKMFGTFVEEKEKVRYGVVPPLNSLNPFWIYLHGLSNLSSKMYRTKGLSNKLAYLIMPPGWAPKKKDTDLAKETANS